MRPASVLLFFSDDMSLEKWAERGMYDREIEIYRRLNEEGVRCHFFTYGSSGEARLARQMERIGVIYNRWNLKKSFFRILAIIRYWNVFVKCAIFKTQQVKGAWYAVILKRMFRKKLIVRCGYLPSRFVAMGHYGSETIKNKMRRLESLAFKHADLIVVTGEVYREYVMKNYALPAERVMVIPNYVDVQVFKDSPEGGRREDRGERAYKQLLTIAKNHPQKNLDSLIEALKGLPDVELKVVGAAIQNDALQEKANAYGLKIKFLGAVPNSRLPELLRASDLFVLPSLYEGHCKSILEAMACGLPVIAADVEGVREVIEHRVNGYLCETHPESIRSALLTVLRDERLMQSMGRHAREYVVKNCSLDEALKMERAAYEKVLAHA